MSSEVWHQDVHAAERALAAHAHPTVPIESQSWRAVTFGAYVDALRLVRRVDRGYAAALKEPNE